jgi:hypothetical protein
MHSFFILRVDMDLSTPPAWAYSWCYYFLFAAAIPVISAVLLLLNNEGKIGMSALLLFSFAALIQGATFLTMFWMCRTSLKPFA